MKNISYYYAECNEYCVESEKLGFDHDHDLLQLCDDCADFAINHDGLAGSDSNLIYCENCD